MRILSLIHAEYGPSGSFGDVARERGHEVVACVAARGLPPGAAEEFDAFLVFGGSLQVDEEERYPWLQPEVELLRQALERDAPVFGVCLGGQLLAKAAGAHVGPAERPEIGWHQVELTPAAAADPIFGALPERFDALQWHSYAFELPPGGVALAENPVCLQGYRLGEQAWGVQFHPEVTRPILERWLASDDGQGHRFEFEPVPAWEELGRGLAERFLDVAAVPAARPAASASSSPGRRS